MTDSKTKNSSDPYGQWDQWIRSGQAHLARKAIESFLDAKRVPGHHRRRVASLARRTGLADRGLVLLRPLVRPDLTPSRGTAEERAEYAACLVRVGAVSEALKWLEGVETSRVPEALLFRAFAEIAQWDYARAADSLRAYLAVPGIPAYERLIARVNLLAALVVEQNGQEATRLASELLEETHRPDLAFIRSSVLDSAAQSALTSKQWDLASERLRQAELHLKDRDAVESLFLRKWKALSALSRNRRGAEKALLEVRQSAVRFRHWETLRSCDWMQATLTDNDELLVRVYAGTPFPAFRERILRFHEGSLELPELYERQLRPGKRVSRLLLADTKEARVRLEGQLLLSTAVTLACDFYRPWSIPALFARLYPDSHYDPYSSRLRVQRMIHRLREWLSDHSPVRVEFLNSAYGLAARAPASVVLSVHERETTNYSRTIRIARECFAEREFSVGELEKQLKTSRRTALFYLQEAFARGEVRRRGKARATVYRFVST